VLRWERIGEVDIACLKMNAITVKKLQAGVKVAMVKLREVTVRRYVVKMQAENASQIG
jgi:hypothetical protein